MSTPPKPRHPGGRPPLVPGERSIEIGFSLPEPHARALVAAAQVERTSTQDICRRAITKFLRDRQRSQARMARRLVLNRGRIGL